MSGIDFAVTWGREFCSSINADLGSCGADAWSVFDGAFNVSPTLDFMKQMGDAEFVRLRDAANEYFEVDCVTEAQMRHAVQQTIWHQEAE